MYFNVLQFLSAALETCETILEHKDRLHKYVNAHAYYSSSGLPTQCAIQQLGQANYCRCNDTLNIGNMWATSDSF